MIARIARTKVSATSRNGDARLSGERVFLLQLWARLLAVLSAFVLSVVALAAQASGLEPLSSDDVRYYRAAFAAAGIAMGAAAEFKCIATT